MIKKKNKSCFGLLLIIFLLTMIIPQVIYASELTEVDTRSTVIITANVPQGFSEKIAFVLEQDSTQVRFSYALTKDNHYMGSISVVGGTTYTASVSFPSSSKHQTNLAEKYEIEGEEVELTFNVETIKFSSETEEDNTLATKTTHGEESNTEIDIQTADNVLNNYLEKVSFVQEDKKFFSFLTTYSGDMFKKYYLEADPMNTEEQWDNMKEIERFNYYITYYMPYTKMMNYQFDTENEFINELVAQKAILQTIDNGDMVYDAIVNVWKWHYEYWRYTGTFYNFHNYYDGTNAETPTTTEIIKLENKEKEELKEVKSEMEEEINLEKKVVSRKVANPFILWIKENFLTCIILVVTSITFLVVYLYNHKKNMGN